MERIEVYMYQFNLNTLCRTGDYALSIELQIEHPYYVERILIRIDLLNGFFLERF